jgi:hypothetical protein
MQDASLTYGSLTYEDGCADASLHSNANASLHVGVDGSLHLSMDANADMCKWLNVSQELHCAVGTLAPELDYVFRLAVYDQNPICTQILERWPNEVVQPHLNYYEHRKKYLLHLRDSLCEAIAYAKQH